MIKIIIVWIVLLISTSSLQAQVRIEMKNEGGVYTTPCIVNGLKLRFIFDTGATNVSISLSEALFMLKNGYLDEADLHGSSYSQIANGNVVKNTTILIRELEIGGIKLQNINAIIIHELSAPLLLGQSAIQKLGKIQMEGNELVIMNINSPDSPNAVDESESLKVSASKYYKDGLYSLAAEAYQKAYDMNPNAMESGSLGDLGCSYYFSDKYQSAIQYLQMAEKLETDQTMLYYLYLFLSNSYMGLKDYDHAVLNCQKAIVKTKENLKLHECYALLGNIKLDEKKYGEAGDFYQKSLSFYLNHLNLGISSFEDIESGRFKDQELGRLFSRIGICFAFQNDRAREIPFMRRAARQGNEIAIRYCNDTDIKF